MIAGTLEIQLLANMARLQKDMDEAKRAVGGAMASIEKSINVAKAAFAALAGVVSVGMFASFIRSAADAADEMNDLSQRVGIAVKDLAKYELAASQSGTTMDALAKGIKGLGASIHEHGDALKAAGISARDADGAMRQVADLFARMPDGIEKTNLAVKLLGKSGMDLIPMLNMGAEGLDDSAEKTAKYAATMATMAPQADAFNDNMAEIALHSKAAGYSIVNDALPAMARISAAMAQAAQESGILKAAWAGFGAGLYELIGRPAEIMWLRFNAGIDEANAKLMSFFGNTKAAGELLNAVNERRLKILALEAETATPAAESPKTFDPKTWVEEYKKLMAAIGGATGAKAKHVEKTYEESDAYKEAMKAARERAKSRNDEYEAIEKHLQGEESARIEAVKAANDAVRAAQDEYDQYGMTRSQIEEITLARLRDKQAAFDSHTEQYKALQQQIEAREKLIGILKKGEIREASDKAAEEHKKAWERANEDISRSLTDAIMRGGKSAGEYLKDYFRTLRLRPFVQAIANPIAGALNGMFGLDSMAGAANSGTSILSAFSSASGLYSAGQTLYSGFQAGLTGTFANFAGSAGNLFGSTALQSFAAGMKGASLGAGIAGPTTQGAGGAMGFGATAAKAIPIIGWIIAGMMKNASWYDQGWRPDNGTMSTAGKLIGSPSLIPDKILRSLGVSGKTAAILTGSALFSRAFGRKDPEVTSFGFQGDFTDDGFVGGKNFQRWKAKGGWFRSDKEGTEYSAIDDAFAETLSDGYKLLKAVNEDYAKALGLTTDTINDYKKALVQDLTGDDSKDAEILAGIMADISEELASKLLPNFAEFAEAGEAAAATLQRLATEYVAVDGALTAIGMTFGAVGLTSSNARTRLLDLMGGIDALASASGFFADNFLTDAERLEPVQKLVTDEMARLGHAGVKTHEQFKVLVKGLNLADEADAKLYASLMKVAPAFDVVADAALVAAQNEQALARSRQDLEIRIMELSGDTAGALAAQRALELAGMDESLRPLQQRIYLLQDEAMATERANVEAENLKVRAMSAVDGAFAGLQRAVDAQRDVVTEAYEAAMASISDSLDVVNGRIGKLSSLSNTLKSTVDRMRLPAEFGASRAAAQAQITAALAIARAGGVLPDADALSGALEIVAQPAEQLYATFQDYQRDFLMQRANIDELSKLTDAQLTTEEKTLSALKDQQTVLESGYQAEMDRLDGILQTAQDQIAVLNGIDISIKSVEAAIAGFKSAISGALAAGATGGGANSATFGGSGYGSAGGYGGASNGQGATDKLSAVESLYAKYSSMSYLTEEGGAYWAAQFNKGIPKADIEKAFQDSVKAVRGYATGGMHLGGLRIVGEQGPELEATGPARIWNAGQTAAFLGGGSAALAAELKALREENRNMRAELQAIAQHTNGTRKLLERAMPNGSALAVVVEEA